MMPVSASQRVLFLVVEGFCKPDTLELEKGNWSGTTVRQCKGPSRLHVRNEKVFSFVEQVFGLQAAPKI